MDAGKLVKFGAIGLGAWWLWSKYQDGSLFGSLSSPAPGANSAGTVPTQSTGTAPVPAGTVPSSSAPAGATAGPSLADQLTAAATGNALFSVGSGQLTGTADQWNYYRNQLRPPELTAAQFGSAFPGMTDTDRGPMITAAQFVAKLSGAGLSGLGARFVPVPGVSKLRNGQRTLVWSMNPRRMGA